MQIRSVFFVSIMLRIELHFIRSLNWSLCTWSGHLLFVYLLSLEHFEIKSGGVKLLALLFFCQICLRATWGRLQVVSPSMIFSFWSSWNSEMAKWISAKLVWSYLFRCSPCEFIHKQKSLISISSELQNNISMEENVLKYLKSLGSRLKFPKFPWKIS